jgi:hypothetical protein
MTRKAKPPDDPEQYARFLEAAKAAGASDDPKALDKAVMRVAPSSQAAKPAKK